MSRLLLMIGVAACGAPAVVAPSPTPRPHRSIPPDRAPIDAIAALAPGAGDISWVVPGRAQLELGGVTIDGVPGREPIETSVIDEQGNLVRVAVRLEAVRFSLWMDRALLMGVLRRDQPIAAGAGRGVMPNEPTAMLLAGAQVQRLAHKEHSTSVRYGGAVEVEGWIPDDALADRGPSRERVGRIPSGRQTLMVVPGAVIRGEPQWAGRQLAVMATGYFVDQVRELDREWVEVEYVDGDVVVRGFLSRRAPPGQFHRRHVENPPAPVVANTKVASGTCLYARTGGEPVGYIVGDRAIQLDDAGRNWWTLTLDTPWGPLAFGAHGASATELAVCAPPNTVPPPAAPP